MRVSGLFYVQDVRYSAKRHGCRCAYVQDVGKGREQERKRKLCAGVRYASVSQ
jgi:hypothetical protein